MCVHVQTSSSEIWDLQVEGPELQQIQEAHDK